MRFATTSKPDRTAEETAVIAMTGAGVALLSGLAGVTAGAVIGLILTLLAWAVRPVFLRASAVVFGTLFLFQNEEVPGTVKLAFVAACWIFGLVSIKRIRQATDGNDKKLKRIAKGSFASAAILAGLPIATLLQIGFTGATLEAWVRDAVGYLLLPVAILVGLDAALSLSPRSKWTLALTASTLAAASSLGTWLMRRGGAELGFAQLGVATSLPVFVGIALCLAMYFNGARRHLWWLLAALTLIGLLVATGGRQPVLFATIAIALGAIFAGGNYIQRLSRVAGVALATVLTYGIVITTSEQFGGGIAARRLDFFDRLFDDGWSAVTADGSIVDRTNAYAWTLEIWLQNPIFGRGLGLPFPSVRSGVVDDGAFTLDTPLVGLAKFGIIGTLAISLGIIAILLLGSAGRGLHKDSRINRATFLVVASGLLLATVPNGFPPENRGFPLFVLLFLMIAIPSFRERHMRPDPLPITVAPNTRDPKTRTTRVPGNRSKDAIK